jgi:hypothetical protein
MGLIMSRRLFLLLVAVIGVSLFPMSASAHVLVKDQTSGKGAILHVSPDDDPIAGERATLFFDIRDSSINPTSSQARLTVTDAQGVASVVSSDLLGSSLSASYVFPRQGLYEIKLVITHNDKTTLTFSQSQRVGRGTIGSVNTHSTPVWAEIGILFTPMAIAFMAIIAFNRRRAINQYSK